MATSRSELLHRVAQALLDLDMLSEGSTQSFDAMPRSGAASRPPAGAGGDSSIEHHLGRLERWCGDAEARVGAERKGRRVEPETRERFRARVLRDYRGVDSTTVAARERCSASLIRRIRSEAGQASG